MLLDSPLVAEQRQNATLIDESGQLLLRLINDILDLARAESGKLTVEPQWCSLLDVLESSTLLCYGSASARDNDLFLIVDPSLPALVFLDSVRMQQVRVVHADTPTGFFLSHSHSHSRSLCLSRFLALCYRCSTI